MTYHRATVYKLTNTVTGLFYVGVTVVPLSIRRSQHLSRMKYKDHPSRAMNTGLGFKRDWIIEALAVVPYEFRFEAENVYIVLLRPPLNERVPWRSGCRVNINRYLKFF